MMATISKTCDVFISHASSDSHLATEIAATLKSVGLEAFHGGAIQLGENFAEAVWEAMAESRALIVIISPDVPTHAMVMIEVGAAAAWNKPVFLLINGPSSTKLPPVLSGFRAYPLGRLEEVIRAIRTGFVPLTENERDLLVDTYCDLGTPADLLSQAPKALRELTRNFNKRIDKQYSKERLLSELLRMRKNGQLPRLPTRAK